MTEAIQIIDHSKRAETAFVDHHIGLGTKHELAYLEPPEELALRENAENGWELDCEPLRKEPWRPRI
ncbi:hypothetical protein [Ruegeria arenilitoris]|uniref:hypothetical protein n=1 Tax=Ruegeria arenilitoris TaxID=1173585 RepID=UPI001C2C5964|nr:hypothetical protein [Ruegeria arenilitoris]